MKENLFKSVKLTIVSLIYLSGVYTIVILGSARVFVPGGGSIMPLNDSGIETGCINIGQAFSKEKYFQGRPSAVNYNASASGGSNKGPTNPEYLETVKQRIDTFLMKNPGVNKSDIPSELVTASGSGLDPHISKRAAEIQIRRVAKERNIPENKLQDLINANMECPELGLFGTERINVLKLNISLDELSK